MLKQNWTLMYIRVHYPHVPPGVPGRCQTISAPCPELSAGQLWRKSQNSLNSRPQASLRPIRRQQDRAQARSTRRGSAGTTVTRAVTRETSGTVSGGTGPRAPHRKLLPGHQKRKRPKTMRRRRAGATGPLRSTGTTGVAAGHPRESLKNGNTTSTVNNFFSRYFSRVRKTRRPVPRDPGSD